MGNEFARGCLSLVGGDKKRVQIIGWLPIVATLMLLSGCDRPEPERGWNIPTDPQEKAAYEYAHNLKLPDSVPEAVPFDFTKAKLNALLPGNPSVSEQYFEHLCSTEAGEYIFKTVENVEGIFQMRPRSKPGELDYDRYGPEEPTGFGWSNDVDDNYGYGVSETYVQPLIGEYRYIERQQSRDDSKVMRFKRGENSNPPVGHKNGYQTAFHTPSGLQVWLRLPFVVVKEDDSIRRARYGFTWRGIKRERDREFSIGAGEYLIVDLDTNEVLAVKRRFKISGRDQNTVSRIWWENARPCKDDILRRKGLTPSPIPINQFVENVLVPISGINNGYIPDEYRSKIEEEI
ncbi:hypothetical protein ACFL2V_19475 [Pseudomonadota bacterium]